LTHTIRSLITGTCRYCPAGKTFQWAKDADVSASISTIRYYAGWADKIQGKTIETNKNKLVYTLHEPFGVVGQIIPWNFPRTFPS
jgi:aldehyde dehydrogenase (NAD+)